jgi:hypothetical protein
LDASDLDESGAFRVVGLLSCARAIDAAVAEERERAAKAIENEAFWFQMNLYECSPRYVAQRAARAIRAGEGA